MKLKTPPALALSLIQSIPHKTCEKAIAEHWRVLADGSVRAQSVMWLFCWAKTGMNSEEARLVASDVFDQVLPVTFADCDRLIDHEYARGARYASEDLEQELEVMLEPVMAGMNSD